MSYNTKTEIFNHFDEAFAEHFIKKEYKELLEKLAEAGWAGIEHHPSRTIIRHFKWFGFAIEHKYQRGLFPKYIITERGIEYARRLPLVAAPDDYNRDPNLDSILEETQKTRKVEPPKEKQRRD